jgi:hypothetical protein
MHIIYHGWLIYIAALAAGLYQESDTGRIIGLMTFSKQDGKSLIRMLQYRKNGKVSDLIKQAEKAATESKKKISWPGCKI